MGPQPPQDPTLIPRPALEVDGVRVHPGLLGFQVEEVPNAPHRCRVLLEVPPLEGEPPERFPNFGQALTLSMELAGAGAAPERLFQGRILALGRRRNRGGAPRTEVEAADALQSLAMTRRSRVFPEGAGASVIQEVAASHGLTAEVELPSHLPAVIVQADETDLALLRRLAHQADSVFQVEGSTLRFVPLDHGDGEVVTLSPDSDLLEYRIRADLSSQRAEVEVRGWDPGVKDRIAARPGPGDVGVSPSPLPSGPQVLAESWGWGGLPPTEPSVRLGPSTPQEARGWAGAWARSLERGFVELRGTVGPGPPWIRPGRPLELTETGAQFSGRYRVVACRHLMDPKEGFRTEFRALR